MSKKKKVLRQMDERGGTRGEIWECTKKKKCSDQHENFSFRWQPSVIVLIVTSARLFLYTRVRSNEWKKTGPGRCDAFCFGMWAKRQKENDETFPLRGKAARRSSQGEENPSRSWSATVCAICAEWQADPVRRISLGGEKKVLQRARRSVVVDLLDCTKLIVLLE